MRKILLTAIFGSFVYNALAQHAWVASYNGAASKQDGIRAIAQGSDGSIYVTGLSEGRKGNRDYAVVKYNAAGVQQWVARYNGPGNDADIPYSIDVDDFDNVYVTGGSIGSTGTFDYATVKYTKDGQFQWASRYEGARNDIAKDVHVSGSYVYVTGFADGANQFNGNEIYTVKYDLDGIKKWENDFNSLQDDFSGSATSREEGTSLTTDGSGNIYITGTCGLMATIKYLKIDETNYSNEWVKKGDAAFGNGREVMVDQSDNILVTGFGSQTIKYAPDGTELWKVTYPGESAFNDIVLDATGNVYVTGRSANGTNGDDYITVRFNGVDGTRMWEKTFTGSAIGGSDNAQSIAYAANGTQEFIYVTGRCVNKVGKSNIGVIATVKYDAQTGAQISTWFYDGKDNLGSSAFEVAVGANGAIFIGGETTYKTSSFDFTTLKYVDAALNNLTTTSNSLLTPVSYDKSVRLSTFPNPISSNGIVQFELSNDTYLRISVLDNLGREVKQLSAAKYNEGIHNIYFNRTSLPSGTYFVRLQTESKRLVTKVILTR